jgi:hypothetical protein
MVKYEILSWHFPNATGETNNKKVSLHSNRSGRDFILTLQAQSVVSSLCSIF